jgi:asparagine synthase (glutamine-hydrolysing)
VDSSLITALAVRASSDLQTFTIGFPGRGKLDETGHARLIAKYFGTNHRELMAKDITPEIIVRLAHQFDEPMADSSTIPTYLVSQLVGQYCKVALGGDGGDELFGGYHHYNRLNSLKRNFAHIPLIFRRGISFSAEKLLPLGFKGRNLLQNFGADLVNSLPLTSPFFDRSNRVKLNPILKGLSLDAETVKKDLHPIHSDLIQRATRMDFKNYLAEDILTKIDRSSMLCSVELRSPFLDTNLIEFAFSKINSDLKIRRNEKKILLKKLAMKLLPKNFDYKRKQGFSIPISMWLKNGPFRDLFWDTLMNQNCIFDRKMVHGLLTGQDKGRSNGERLFALLQFELWRDKYCITI